MTLHVRNILVFLCGGGVGFTGEVTTYVWFITLLTIQLLL